MTATPPEPRTRRLRPLRVAAALFIGGTFLFWIYALSGVARRDPPDLLAESTFPEAAEPICAIAVADVAALPGALDAETAAERADSLDVATDRLDAMVVDLRAVAPPLPRDDATEVIDTDAETIWAWLDDWAIYLGDRRAYAEQLRDDAGARFQNSARDGQAITVPMDHFARVNRMASCETPGDVG